MAFGRTTHIRTLWCGQVPGCKVSYLPEIPMFKGCNGSTSGSTCCFVTYNWTEAGRRVEDCFFFASSNQWVDHLTQVRSLDRKNVSESVQRLWVCPVSWQHLKKKEHPVVRSESQGIMSIMWLVTNIETSRMLLGVFFGRNRSECNPESCGTSTFGVGDAWWLLWQLPGWLQTGQFERCEISQVLMGIAVSIFEAMYDRSITNIHDIE